MEWFTIALLASVSLLLITIGVPISFAIALASLSALLSVIPPEAAAQLVTQKLASSLDSFTLLAIPFFILAGNIIHGYVMGDGLLRDPFAGLRNLEKLL